MYIRIPSHGYHEDKICPKCNNPTFKMGYKHKPIAKAKLEKMSLPEIFAMMVDQRNPQDVEKYKQKLNYKV